MTIRILHGDCRSVLKTLPDASVHCCVTSPPYFGLRDYGHAGQIGLEPTPAEYVAQMVEVFREVRRVLRDDGTLWLNLGDSYVSSGAAQVPDGKNPNAGVMRPGNPDKNRGNSNRDGVRMNGLAPKNLIGIPWRVAFALQADGWYLRQDIIWSKPNPMPESVRDRCTKAHEYVFLMSKSERYYYDAEAISEQATGRDPGNVSHKYAEDGIYTAGAQKNIAKCGAVETRNKRSVWNIATKPFAEAHFATMAPELAENCIKAGRPVGGVVLDPFGGAGTTGLVADQLQRNALLVELNTDYIAIAQRRIAADAPLFAEVTA